MKCEIIRDLMPLYLDDCCSEGSRELVREHVKGCASCRKLLGEMSKELVIGTEEKNNNLLEEELLKTGKEVIKTEVRENYLENMIWMDMPLNVIICIFGIIAMLKYNIYNYYSYERLLSMAWEKSVLLDIYTSVGNPMTVGLSIFFLFGEILHLKNARKKGQTAILTSIALESVFYKFIMFVTFAIIGLMLMLQK